MRDFECIHYDECLSKAAHENGPLDCDLCPRFQRRPEGSEGARAEMEGLFDLLHAVLLEKGNEVSTAHSRI